MGNLFRNLVKIFSIRDVSSILIIAFVSLLLIILFNWQSSEHRLLDMWKTIDQNQLASKKMHMVNNLIELARTRTRLTDLVINEADPFAQDELGMELDILAARFARQRLELIELPLSAKEQQFLLKQADIVPIILPAQRKAVELAMTGDPESLVEADRLLREVVNPGQNQLVNVFMELVDLQQQNIESLAIESQKSNEAAQRRNRILVIIALVLGIIVSTIAVLRVLSIQRKIAESRDELEIAVKNRTQQLAESQSTLQTVLDTIPTRVFWKDIHGAYRGCNQLFALDAQIEDINELIGKHDDELDWLNNVVSNENEDKEIIKTGNSIIDREEFTDNEGKQTWWEVTKVPLKDSDNNIIGMLCSYIDITERKRINRMKDEFVSTVSHELRTPLTSISGSHSLLLGGVIEELSPKVHDLLDLANRNTKRLLSLINDILDLQKMEAGKMKYEFSPIDLSTLVERAIEENSEYAKQYDIKLELKESSSMFANVDENRMMQVLGNLISNAIKFSEQGASVELSLTQYEENARIQVIDHGRGIPEHFHKTLFNKFTQVDSSDSRQKGGTGLGLAITKSIIEKHKGNISFISKIDEGTTFYCELPLLKPESSKSNTAANY